MQLQKLRKQTAALANAAFRFVTVDRQWKHLAIGVAAAAAIFALIVLGPGYILGTNAYWQHPLYDAGAHLSGWLFFKEDAWHFPIFETFRMNAPDGASVLFTDSIPLLAGIFKLLGLGALGNWHYFGAFVALAYVLNSVAFLWLLKQLNVRNILGAAAAFVFTCFIALHNLQFESFYSHFFILFSLGFYFKLTRQFSKKYLAVFIAMVVTAALVHPYIFGMSAAILVVTLFTLWRHKTLTLPSTLKWAGIFAVITGIVVVVSGHFAYKPTGFQEKLYGLDSAFALDLTAPFTKAYTVNEIGTYFGLGFWIIVLTACVLLWRRKKELLKRHVWLVLLAVAFLLFAISTTIFLHGDIFLKFNVPAPLMNAFETFRASKRFVIPVFYIAIAVALVVALRKRTKLVTGIVAVALVVQVVDVMYFTTSLHATARKPNPILLDTDFWVAESKDVSSINTFPSYSCLYDNHPTPKTKGQFDMSREFYLIAAREHKISNSARVAKRTKDCVNEIHTGTTSTPKNALLIYMKDDNGVFEITPPQWCLDQKKEFQFGIYCKS